MNIWFQKLHYTQVMKYAFHCIYAQKSNCIQAQDNAFREFHHKIQV